VRRLSIAITAILATMSGALAQVYPARVITVVVPLPPGGATDRLTRTLDPNRSFGRPCNG
jgi:tripartite-type tricarboxylate transporter receptor subunit TctC